MGDTAVLDAASAAKAEKMEAEFKARQAKADETNKTRTGKGTRVFVGKTRGKGTQVIDWEAFDDSKPDTLPKSTQEFLDITKITEDSRLVSLLIDGFNAQSYTAASDPISEYVEAYWPEEVQKSFRVIVRQYAATMEIGLDEAVGLVKPAIDKKYKK